MIDRWFLDNIKELIDFETKLKTYKNKKVPVEVLRQAKVMGFSDIQLAKFWGSTEEAVYKLRKEKGVIPQFKLVDTCAAEFEAYTPYYYSTYS
jgi:carbamoyl-phosphate synthase large subunit